MNRLRTADCGLRIVAAGYGPEVAQMLKGHGGRVLAILSNTVYLESYKGYVAAIVGHAAADGPMSLRVNNLPTLLSALQGHHNLSFSITPQGIHLGDLAHVSLHNAHYWQPAMPPLLGEPTACIQAAYALAQAIADAATQEIIGLANLVRSCHSEWHIQQINVRKQAPSVHCHSSLRSESRRPSALFGLARNKSSVLVCEILSEAKNDKGELGKRHELAGCATERSEESLSKAVCWSARFFASRRMTKESERCNNEQSALFSLFLARIAAGICQFADAVRVNDGERAGHALTQLLGLGPGLTPSGDDLVSGIVASLVWQANLGAIDPVLAQNVIAQVRAATGRTNRISAKLLHYAGEGILYAPAMQLGAALLAGDSDGVAAPAHQLFTIGNTSGVDLAVGLLIGCLSVQQIAQ